MDAALSQRLGERSIADRRPQQLPREHRHAGRAAATQEAATAGGVATAPDFEVAIPRIMAGDAAHPAPATATAGVWVAEASPTTELAIRALNVAVAGIAILLLLPVFLLVALAVKLTSHGPALYTQTRVGVDRRWKRRRASADHRQEDLGGKPFTIYKFRSMRVDAEHEGRAVWATREDSRVTPVGRVIRRTRLDELPQLFNVIRGDMNIVGPRPERPSIFAQLRQDIPEYPLRQRARPGITGWAQINQSYDSCVEDVRRKVRFDLEYLGRRSVGEDVKIMLKTVPVMLFKRGGW
jgi:lipopolysaccharide/colanic/teichoic acid biosynthesis glycosyltransferase